MNEKERQAFALAYNFYEKWRDTVIEGSRWDDFAKDVDRLGRDLDIGNNPIGWHLMNAVLDTFNDMYKGGMKPLPENYFGRDDI